MFLIYIVIWCYFEFYFISKQFMEWKVQNSKFWGQISINKISININLKFMKLVAYDSSQDVNSFYKKKWNILASHKKFIYT